MTTNNYECLPKFNDIENIEFILQRYYQFKSGTTTCKRSYVISKCKSLFNRFSGLSYGMVEGVWTGMAIGGKWGGNGGWIAGGVTQLICLLLSPILNACHGAIIGAFTSKPEIYQILLNYRKQLASTKGVPTATTNI